MDNKRTDPIQRKDTFKNFIETYCYDIILNFEIKKQQKKLGNSNTKVIKLKRN